MFIWFHDDTGAHLAPEHIECFMRQIIGSTAHQQRRCSCFGGKETDDDVKLSPREAARAAFEFWQEQQRSQPDTHTHTHTRNNHATTGEQVLYFGQRTSDGPSVFVQRDGRQSKLSPRRALSLRKHSKSENGFEWARGGFGPAQLSLAILLDFTGDDEIALQHYQEFKRTVGGFDRASWQFTDQQLHDWFASQGISLPPHNNTPRKTT